MSRRSDIGQFYRNVYAAAAYVPPDPDYVRPCGGTRDWDGIQSFHNSLLGRVVWLWTCNCGKRSATGMCDSEQEARVALAAHVAGSGQ
jgi:hypothetical protein